VDALDHILNRIQSVKAAPELFTLIGWLHSMKLVVFFDWDVSVDSQDPSRNLLNLQQGGITLPDPDYYLQPHSADKVLALQHVAQQIFTLAGISNPAQSAADAVAFEALLARGFLSNSKHGFKQVRVSFAAFVHLTQKFDWVSVFAGIGDVDAKWDGMISVDHVNFFEHMSSLILAQPMQQLRSYMTWRVLKTFAPFMSPPYERTMQTLDHMLLGTAKEESRWRKCLDSSTDNVQPPFWSPSPPECLILTQVPTLLSLVFDTTFLTPSIEYVASLMVSLVRQAFNETIAREDWLDQPTVVLAQRKLKAALVRKPPKLCTHVHAPTYFFYCILYFTQLQINLGGPNPKESFTEAAKEDFPVVSNFVSNLLNAQSNLIHLRIKRLNAPVQRGSWAGCAYQYFTNSYSFLLQAPGSVAQMLMHFTSATPMQYSFPAPSCSHPFSARTGSWKPHAHVLHLPSNTVAVLSDPCPGILVLLAPSSVMSSHTDSTTRAGCSMSIACTGIGGPTMLRTRSLKGRSAYLIYTGPLFLQCCFKVFFSDYFRLQLILVHQWSRQRQIYPARGPG
jgi:hypothetical protein